MTVYSHGKCVKCRQSTKQKWWLNDARRRFVLYICSSAPTTNTNTFAVFIASENISSVCTETRICISIGGWNGHRQCTLWSSLCFSLSFLCYWFSSEAVRPISLNTDIDTNTQTLSSDAVPYCVTGMQINLKECCVLRVRVRVECGSFEFHAFSPHHRFAF